MPKKEEPKPIVKRPPIELAVVKKKEETPAEKKIEPNPKKTDPKTEPEPKKIETKPEVKKPTGAKVIAIGDDLIKLNDPDGEYTIKTLNRGLKAKVIGTIKTLKIAGANEGSVLDASDLIADEVVFLANINSGSTIILGKAGSIQVRDVNDRSTIDASASEARTFVLTGAVNSASTVKVGAPKGTVEFLGEINDRSEIVVNAPDGKVLFKSKSESVITSDTKLAIVARDVEFQGAIHGIKTQLDITLTQGGTLKVRRVTGGVNLHYRKASAADPDPRLTLQEIDARSRVQLVPPLKK
jgi:hypothetical protein